MIVSYVDRQFIKEQIVHVAISPILARLERFHDRMVGRVIMLGGVFVLGIVAAAHVSADLAQAQMDPGVSHLQAFLAAV
jgi:hypothetical protein